MSHSISIVPAPHRPRAARDSRGRRLLVVSTQAADATAFADLARVGTAVRFDAVIEPRLTAVLHRVGVESFDAVVVSSDLLDAAGLQTVARLCELAPHTPVLALATVDNPRQVARAIRHGVQDVLLRAELTVDRLARAVAAGRARAGRLVELRDLSLTDSLTGLCNRRGFMLLAESQVRLLRRTHRQSLLLFADVDDLKAINDQAGHAAGDRALRACAKALRGALRDSDLVARYGGDEFAAVALDVSEGAALILLPRIATWLERASRTLRLPSPLTMSVGTASFLRGGLTLEEVLERADRAMYREKRRVLASATSA